MTSLLGPDAELRWANWLKFLQIPKSLILYRSPKIVTKFTRDHFFGPFDIDYGIYYQGLNHLYPPPIFFLKLSYWDGAFAFKWGWLGHYTNMYKYISETVNKCSGRQSRNTDRNVTERDDFDGWYSETVFCQLFPKWAKDRWSGEEGNPFSNSKMKNM